MDNNEFKEKERSGRGLFYGVIAVSVFVIMAVGATFAYFAASADSGTNSITTSSASLDLKLLSYESAWSKNDLIPVDNNIVRYGFANQNDTTIKVQSQTCYNSGDEEVSCEDVSVVPEKTVTTYSSDLSNTLCVDDYGNSVCSVYVFQIVNDNAYPQNLSFNLISDLNTFENLKAMAYEVSISNVDDYNSIDNNNHNGDPDSFTVKDGITTVDSSMYTPIYINRNGVNKVALNDRSGSLSDVLLPSVLEGTASDENISTRTANVASNVGIESNETKTFAIVLYIQNLPMAQSNDEDSLFQGYINVTTGDGTPGVRGYISAADTGNIQP